MSVEECSTPKYLDEISADTEEGKRLEERYLKTVGTEFTSSTQQRE